MAFAVVCVSFCVDLAAVSLAEGQQSPRTQVCVASYISSKFHGRKTASGEIYDKNKLTAAHRTYPLGTMVRVTNLRNGKRVTLLINDRGPFTKGRGMDVSFRAAQELGFVRHGKTKVKIEMINSNL
jgi:rare lipoprotein A